MISPAGTGGEEFVIGMPETTLEDARERAERLREKIAQITIQYMGKNLGPVTISVGVAVLPDHVTERAAAVGRRGALPGQGAREEPGGSGRQEG
jgi:diguanylate cyclase (GGDEF)-like protein